MHTEEIRVRRSARAVRKLLFPENHRNGLMPAELLAAADIYAGFSRHELPEGDPLLSGAHALLDRDFCTIWLNRGRSNLDRLVDAAHEYGHLFVHGFQNGIVDDSVISAVAGYSKSQRDEVDADRFATELLLPLPVAKQSFLEGKSAADIADRYGLPHWLVLKQLIAAFGADERDFETKEYTRPLLDDWQSSAAYCSGPAFVYGQKGTGKTEALIARCIFLIAECQVAPSAILAITSSVKKAQRLRSELSVSGNSIGLLVPIATTYQLAYDILVRFPEEAGWQKGWELDRGFKEEIDVKQLPLMAVNVLQRTEVVQKSLRARYQHLLADDIDRLDSNSVSLLTAMTSGSESGIWATSRTKTPPSFHPMKTFALPFQYQATTNLFEFRKKLSPDNDKKVISRRLADSRSAQGTITVAISTSRDQEIEGIARLIDQKLSEGYHPGDIKIIHRMTGSGDALWEDVMRERLFEKHLTSTNVRYTATLLAVVDLIAGNWKPASIVRVGRMKQYSIPFEQLAMMCKRPMAQRSEQREDFTPELQRMLTDIRQCRGLKSHKSSLLRYVFDVSNILRVSEEAGFAVQTVLQNLSSEPGNILNSQIAQSEASKAYDEITIINSVTTETSSSPIVILAGAELEGASVAALLLAADLCDDHLLLTASSPHVDRLKHQARKFAISKAPVDIVDWTTTASLIEKAPVHGADVGSGEPAEWLLFQQCPRRLYYSRVLETKYAGVMTINDYPTKPCDTALCDTCRFVDICPIDLD